MMNRIQQTFDDLKTKGQKALIPYIMAGDPSLDVTESLVLTLAEGGADLIELGVPFSDPIADGPVIQQAAERALHSGTTLKKNPQLSHVASRPNQCSPHLDGLLQHHSCDGFGKVLCRGGVGRC